MYIIKGEMSLKYSKRAKCLNTFVAHCRFFFVKGGTLVTAEDRSLAGGGGGWGVSSPRKFSNLDALKHSFQHKIYVFEKLNLKQVSEKAGVFHFSGYIFVVTTESHHNQIDPSLKKTESSE